MKYFWLASAFVISTIYVRCSFGEVFSSVAEVEKLITSSDRISELVEKYVESEKQRLERLQE